jgi:hypothetical protein
VYCSTCGDERTFERPPCPDGHGAECPERACVDCGSAVLVGSPLTAPGAAPADDEPAARDGRDAPTASDARTASDAPATVRAVA